MLIMICINPGLWSSSTITSDQDNDVLRPKRPSLEIFCQCQCKSHSALVQIPIHVRPGSNEYNSFRSISPRGVKYSIDVLSTVGIACSVVVVFLPRRSQTGGFEDVTELFGDPDGRRLLGKLYPSRSIAYVRFLILAEQSLDLVLVGVEDILFTPSKIRVHLPWEQSILRNVGVS